MPLFLDYHQFEGNLSVEDVKTLREADSAIQGKYGVRYLQFWANQQAGTVFCLVEAPDESACEKVHREAHGNVACNIREVEPGFFKLFMGEGHPTDHGLTLTEEGIPDSPNRTIMVADIRGVTTIEDAMGFKKLLIPNEPRNLIVDSLVAFNGRFIEHSEDDTLVGVFKSPLNAIRCAISIHDDFSRLAKKHKDNGEWNVIYRLALNNGQPLTREEGFFEVATRQAKRLSLIAGPNQIVLSANLKNLYQMETAVSKNDSFFSSFRILMKSEEDFVHELFHHMDSNLRSESFNVNNLCKLIGMSRPQLYRKIVSLTGSSPNQFITDLRMQLAWELLKTKKNNVSQIAYELGYSNPSYFSKVFLQKFGHSPFTVLSSL